MDIRQFECIKESEIVKNLKKFFIGFSGLDLDIIKLEEGAVRFNCSLNDGRNQFNSKCGFLECNLIKREILQEIISEKKNRFFICPARFKKIVVPLFLNKEVIGLLVVGENDSARLDKAKIDFVSGVSYQLFNYVVENEANTLKYYNGDLITHKQQLLEKVTKYIKANGNRKQLSLKEVASENAVSYHYLSHLFKEELKTTFVQYRKNVKMDIAAKLLNNLKFTVGQVSYICGFDDASYFCKVFKNKFGFSPIDFRKKILFKGGKKIKIRTTLKTPT